MTHFKKLTAFLAAIVMSVSAMSLTAGATQTHNWSLRYIPNSSGTNKSQDKRTFIATYNTVRAYCAAIIQVSVCRSDVHRTDGPI